MAQNTMIKNDTESRSIRLPVSTLARIDKWRAQQGYPLPDWTTAVRTLLDKALDAEEKGKRR